MSTRRFSNLKPSEMLDVLDAFLGSPSRSQFTEKLAGQHMALTVLPGGEVEYVGKGGKTSVGGGLFPQVTRALKNGHPPVARPVPYRFEVLKKTGRSDFIDYPIEADFAAVDLSGLLDQVTADQLNSGQGAVQFIPKETIKKSAASYVKDPQAKEALQAFRNELSSGGKPSKERASQIEQLLMTVIDSGGVPSTLGSERIEGLFGQLDSGSFKIPSKQYDELQKDQSRFVAIVRRVPMKDIETRFQNAADDPAADRFVSDVLDYVDKMASVKLPKGFRTFFSPAEMTGLIGLAAAYRSGDAEAGTQLVKQFFKRVNTKSDWVSSGVQEAAIINDLRKLVREHLISLRKD